MRFRFRIPEAAVIEDNREFVTLCLAVYCLEDHWTSDTLSEYFADDFRQFTAEDFKIVDPDDRRKLRELLRDRRVYVPNGRSILVPDELNAAVKDSLPWPVDKLKRVTVTDKIITGTTAENDVKDSVQRRVQEKKRISTETWTKNGNLSNLSNAYNSDGDRFRGLTQNSFD